jgi:hypothetical protein
MTMLISCVTERLVVMLSDSAITQYHFQEDEETLDHVEYETGNKYIKFQNQCCVTCWGDLTYNSLGEYIRHRKKINDPVSEIAVLAENYLLEKSPMNDIGYHIGGYEKGGTVPKLFHVSWEKNELKKRDLSNFIYAYAGLSDLAQSISEAFLSHLRYGNDTHFDTTSPLGLIQLCDFFARYSAEITPQVGPPFVFNLIFPDNSIYTIVNSSFSPLSIRAVSPHLSKLLTE